MGNSDIIVKDYHIRGKDMIKIAVCDDETIFIDIIVSELKSILINKGISEYAIHTFSNGIELCKLENKISDYQIIFLDINMEQLNGLQTAYYIRKYDKNIFIVFITAFVDYAMEGYKLDAVRFIFKDMLKEMLPECMDAILKRMHLKSGKIIKDFLEGRKEIFVDRILYIESRKHKLYYNIGKPNQEQFSLYGKMDDLEDELKEYNFLRIHKSYLVNMNFLESIMPYKAMMYNGEELPIPREKYKIIKEHFFVEKGDFI